MKMYELENLRVAAMEGVEDIVRRLEGFTLGEIKLLQAIKHVPAAYDNSSALLFEKVWLRQARGGRRAAAAAADDGAAWRNALEANLLVESLVAEPSIPGILVKESVSQELGHDLKERFLEKVVSVRLSPDDHRRLANGTGRSELAVREWRSVLDLAVATREGFSWAYARDLVVPPPGERNDLYKAMGAASLVSGRSLRRCPTAEEDVDASDSEIDEQEMAGINTSYHYVGSRGSTTTMHVEDGMLPSLNLLKGGEPKIWLLVDRRQRCELEKALSAHARAQHNEGGEPSHCPVATQHKNLLPSPRLLDELKITYQLAVQKVGDLMYVRGGTYHAVVNGGMNFAEAMNFGSTEWVASAGQESSACECPENIRQDVFRPNEVRLLPIKESTGWRNYQCSKCSSSLRCLTQLEMHEKYKHGVAAIRKGGAQEEQGLQCRECGKAYKRRQSLSRHMLDKHPASSAIADARLRKKRCNECGESFARLDEHRRKKHGESEMCPKCGRLVKKYRLKEHLAKHY